MHTWLTVLMLNIVMFYTITRCFTHLTQSCFTRPVISNHVIRSSPCDWRLNKDKILAKLLIIIQNAPTRIQACCGRSDLHLHDGLILLAVFFCEEPRTSAAAAFSQPWVHLPLSFSFNFRWPSFNIRWQESDWPNKTWWNNMLCLI